MRANGVESKAVAASLDPQDAIIPASELLTITATLVDPGRLMRLKPINELRNCGICECGRPLVGMEVEFLHDPKGSALWVVGYCLFGCKEQRTMYLSEPRQTEDEHDASIQRDVSALVDQVRQYRRRDDVRPLDVLEDMVEDMRIEAEVGL